MSIFYANVRIKNKLSSRSVYVSMLCDKLPAATHFLFFFAVAMFCRCVPRSFDCHSLISGIILVQLVLYNGLLD